MVHKYLSPKFGAHPRDGFRENDVYERTTGDRRTDAHAMAVALLCSSTKQ